MSDKFQACVNFSLGIEKGYVNNPDDPGGPTNRGITQKTLSDYLGHPASIEDVQNLSLSTALDIYRKNYWAPIHGDDLPPMVALACFDCAVNSGPHESLILLQRALGLHEDGIIGPASIAAINAKVPHDTAVAAITQRFLYMQSLKTWPSFRNGWTERIHLILAKVNSGVL